MNNAAFIPKHPYNFSNLPKSGSVSAQAPSNIALVKYWGKYGEQLPQNASVSFTLSECRTETTLHYEKTPSSEIFNFEVYLDGKREEGFEQKIKKFFERIETYIPFLKEYKFTIETKNTFPHSSGIASSASGMAALALCLASLEKMLMGGNLSTALGQQILKENKEPQEESSITSTSLSSTGAENRLPSGVEVKASFLARLGSGSAARSLEGPLVVWGEHPEINESSNLFGTKYQLEVHKNFANYQDTILLVDKGEKQVSSTVGHDLMNENPYAEARFNTANTNLSRLVPVFERGNISAFIKIVESEALQLHGMMMASMPYFILMKPNTLEIINRIWEYRRETGSQVCFTLDAGANVHVLYPEKGKVEVLDFIKKELAPFCKNGEFIQDKLGQGATVLS